MRGKRTNLAPVEPEDAEGRTPLPELVAPVGQSRLRHEDEVRTRDIEELGVVSQHGDGLQGLAQALWEREGGRERWKEGRKEGGREG